MKILWDREGRGSAEEERFWGIRKTERDVLKVRGNGKGFGIRGRRLGEMGKKVGGRKKYTVYTHGAVCRKINEILTGTVQIIIDSLSYTNYNSLVSEEYPLGFSAGE